MADGIPSDLDELLLRLIADAAVLHALLQDADASHYQRYRRRIEVFLRIVDGLPTAPPHPGSPGIGFRTVRSEKKGRPEKASALTTSGGEEVSHSEPSPEPDKAP